MGKELLIQELKRRKKIEVLQNELKKRAFVKKYFDYDEVSKLDVFSDLKVSEDSFNEVYLKTFNNEQRVNVYYGGAGSGKSEFIARKLILKFLLEKGHNGLFVRKFAIDVRKSIYKLLVKIIEEYMPKNIEKYVKINKTEMTITFWNRNQILLGGLDDNEKIKSITFESGILTDVWVKSAHIKHS